MGLECSIIKSPSERATEWKHPSWVKHMNLKKTKSIIQITDEFVTVPTQRSAGTEIGRIIEEYCVKTMAAIHFFSRKHLKGIILLFYFYDMIFMITIQILFFRMYQESKMFCFYPSRAQNLQRQTRGSGPAQCGETVNAKNMGNKTVSLAVGSFGSGRKLAILENLSTTIKTVVLPDGEFSDKIQEDFHPWTLGNQEYI